MVCLDIGSNIGYYALLERKIVGSEGRVMAVEPSPLIFPYLKKNIQQNGFDDIEMFNFAFTSSDGEVPFLMARKSNLSRVVNGSNCSLKEGLVIKVPARSLDSFAAQYCFKKLDFLRMDVEGHEAEILNGGLWTIERFKPMLLIEVHKSLRGLKKTVNFLQNLKSLGYDVKYYIPRELNMPFIGSMKDIKEIGIDHLIKKLANNSLPDYFHLLLVNANNCSIDSDMVKHSARYAFHKGL
ncbi:MAG: FkbM family methyltransferase [Nitrososphaerota archaeon]